MLTSTGLTAAVPSTSVTTNQADENALAVSEIQAAVTPTADEPPADTEAQLPPLQLQAPIETSMEPKSEPEEQLQDETGGSQDPQDIQQQAQLQLPQLTQLTQLTGAQFHPGQSISHTIIEMLPQTILDHQQLLQHQQFFQQQQQLQSVQVQQQQQQQQLQQHELQDMDKKSGKQGTPGGKGNSLNIL